MNKTDLLAHDWTNSTGLCSISCKTGQGLSEFTNVLKERLSDLCSDSLQESPLITSTRQRNHLQKSVDHLQLFLDIVKRNGDLALAGECLRKAAKEIANITARIDVEEMLDVLFRSFCIGK